MRRPINCHDNSGLSFKAAAGKLENAAPLPRSAVVEFFVHEHSLRDDTTVFGCWIASVVVFLDVLEELKKNIVYRLVLLS